MPATPRGKIYDSILDTMGGTPLVRFPRITAGLPADLCFKLEFFNPCLLYTSPSPRDATLSRMPSSA